ncbi:TetR/AcrR family transcriptional regulator [Actinophytocola oryzae]|uniref:TetR family transcriptional regulator n=1 Tax=Actinophytocola oryzae TaxID=502181 RepID=A0A4R7V9L6_9PSEU|nr:TetR/AcrR family transcriptional regulator [Actinophytocola oryzae]TDV45619.1 TetR family transcriptional regulator [Actinophytocola oryzae]
MTHGLALVWGFPPAPRRGPKPAHTVAEIVAAAMALADGEGVAGLSLPRIARRLDLTPTALYRYVSCKDELVLLLLDAGVGPPPELPDTWREGASAWVRSLIARYGAHPWLVDLPIRGAPVTPNLLAWLESLLRVLGGTGLPPGDQLSCAMLLDGYARSIAALARDLAASEASPVQSPEVVGFLYPLLAERGYPLLAGMLVSGAYADSPTGPDVEFGLARVLDGIARLVDGTG